MPHDDKFWHRHQLILQRADVNGVIIVKGGGFQFSPIFKLGRRASERDSSEQFQQAIVGFIRGNKRIGFFHDVRNAVVVLACWLLVIWPRDILLVVNDE